MAGEVEVGALPPAVLRVNGIGSDRPGLSATAAHVHLPIRSNTMRIRHFTHFIAIRQAGLAPC